MKTRSAFLWVTLRMPSRVVGNCSLDCEGGVWNAYRDRGRVLPIGTAHDPDALVGFIAFEGQASAERLRPRRLGQGIGKLVAG